MKTRQLGRSDVTVPVIIAGAWAIGGGYWGARHDASAIAALRRGLDVGMNAIDTAPIYGLGHSERLVGQAIAGRRDDAVILTKVGLRWDCDDGELFFEGKHDDGSPMKVYRNARPDSVRLEVERSLERLGVDVIDVVQVHWPDPTTPIADTMGALATLREEGKIRAIGVSNYDVEMLKRAQSSLGDVPLASDQPKYSLLAREAEVDVLPHCAAAEVGVVVYSPLEQGLLTGKVTAERVFADDDGRRHRATFQPRNRAVVNAVLKNVVTPVAADCGATLAQVVLAWTVAQRGVTAALAGVRGAEQVDENAGAGDLALPGDAWAAIDAAFTGLSLDLDDGATKK